MSPVFWCLFVLSCSAYNDLCIRGSGMDELDQRYIFDLNSQQPYGEFNLVWKGVKQTQYWFWLARYNGSFEWTIDNDKDDVLRYCTLTTQQQQKVSNGEISYIYPYSCDNWNAHNSKTKQSDPLPRMEVFDCDIYSIDELLEFIVSSTGKTATINEEGKIVVDTYSDRKSENSENESSRDAKWDLRYIDLVYIAVLSILAYFVFKKERNLKRTRYYQAVHSEAELADN